MESVHTCVKVCWRSEQKVPLYEIRITYVVSHKIWVLNQIHILLHGEQEFLIADLPFHPKDR